MSKSSSALLGLLVAPWVTLGSAWSASAPAVASVAPAPAAAQEKRALQTTYVTNAYFSDKLLKVSGFIQPNAVINLLRARHKGIVGYFVMDMVMDKGEHLFDVEILDKQGRKVGDMGFEPVKASENEFVYTMVGAVTGELPEGWLLFRVFDQIKGAERLSIGAFRVMSRVMDIQEEDPSSLLEQTAGGATPAGGALTDPVEEPIPFPVREEDKQAPKAKAEPMEVQSPSLLQEVPPGGGLGRSGGESPAASMADRPPVALPPASSGGEGAPPASVPPMEMVPAAPAETAASVSDRKPETELSPALGAPQPVENKTAAEVPTVASVKEVPGSASSRQEEEPETQENAPEEVSPAASESPPAGEKPPAASESPPAGEKPPAAPELPSAGGKPPAAPEPPSAGGKPPAASESPPAGEKPPAAPEPPSAGGKSPAVSSPDTGAAGKGEEDYPSMLLGKTPPPVPPPPQETRVERSGSASPEEEFSRPTVSTLSSVSEVSRGFVVQLGIYSVAEYAEDMKKQVSGLGLPIGEKVITSMGRSMTRVYLGPFATRREADIAIETVRARVRLKNAVMVIPYP